MNTPFELLHFYISPDHNFFGHHGGPASNHPILAPRELHCVAGRGLEGDRFFDYKENYKGQITFFEHEVFQSLCNEFDVWDVPPSVVRRNVITRGANLNALVGKSFEVQGISFLGVEECKPCYWMDQVFGPGAEDALKGRGGLRARILTSGTLRLSPSLSQQIPDYKSDTSTRGRPKIECSPG